jgi:hypothetical protein
MFDLKAIIYFLIISFDVKEVLTSHVKSWEMLKSHVMMALIQREGTFLKKFKWHAKKYKLQLYIYKIHFNVNRVQELDHEITRNPIHTNLRVCACVQINNFYNYRFNYPIWHHGKKTFIVTYSTTIHSF